MINLRLYFVPKKGIRIDESKAFQQLAEPYVEKMAMNLEWMAKEAQAPIQMSDEDTVVSFGGYISLESTHHRTGNFANEPVWQYLINNVRLSQVDAFKEWAIKFPLHAYNIVFGVSIDGDSEIISHLD